MKVGSLITTVEAKISPNTPISYFFVNEGELTSSVYEFVFKEPYSGQIYLAKSFNRTSAVLREVVKYN